MENENVNYSKEFEDKLLELIFSSVNSNSNVLHHRYYVELLNLGKIIMM